MQIEAAPSVNPPHPTTADHEGDRSPVRSPELGSFPTPPRPDSAERPACAASAANSGMNQDTAISQFLEEKLAEHSFDRVENISEKSVPLGTGRGDKKTWVVLHTFWLHDQKERAASTERTRSDSGEGHENPWMPCQPSEDAKEWNGVEGLDGAPPDVDFDCPATPPVNNGPAVTDDVQRTG